MRLFDVKKVHESESYDEASRRKAREYAAEEHAKALAGQEAYRTQQREIVAQAAVREHARANSEPQPPPPKRIGKKGQPLPDDAPDEDVHDPEWDNRLPEPRLPWHHPDVMKQSERRGEQMKKRMAALRQEDHLLFWRMCDFEDSNFPDNEQPHNVIIAAFPSEYDTEYPYEQGVPKIVEQNPNDYVEIEIPGSWFHEDMRTKDTSDDGPGYGDAHEVCYIRKDFKYRKYVERLVKRHNEVERLINRVHWDEMTRMVDIMVDKHVTN